MIYFILGIIVGLLINRRDQSTVYKRTINQVQSKLQKKGTILTPESEDLSNWIDNLKSDDTN